MKLLSKIRDSLSFRSKRYFRLAIISIYRRKLALQTAPQLPSPKPLSELRLMIFTGRDQLGMLQQSARSIQHGWATIPSMLLVSDGSLSTEELRDALSWWPHEVVATTWQTFAEKAAKRGQTNLAKLAEQNMLGRKLCAILESALEIETLFSDTDILWFKGPPTLPSPANGARIKLAEDFQAMYDERLISELDGKELSELPWLNTGVCFATGNLYAEADLEPLVESAAENPHYFSEQTILSLACKRLGGESWPRSDIYLGLNDEIRLPGASYPGQNWMARHYPGNVRHWFWVDAYFLELARRQETA